jgi:allophanate hydrolase
MRADGTPFGVTLIAPAGCDAALASIGRAFHADTALPLGATGKAQPPLAAIAPRAADGEIALAVVGAHLSGMPLNRELTASGARLLEESATAADYRLFLLPGGAPAKPGLIRAHAGGGGAIAVEIWAMPAGEFGRFIATVPPPLSIGTLTLADGRKVKGFLVEAAATAGARDISGFGGWRAFMAQAKASA